MQKVIYSITHCRKFGDNPKFTGIGYITDEDLITANIGKSGKPYIKIFNCIKYCHQITNSSDEFKGYYNEFVENDDRNIELNYYIWFKLIK